MRKYNKKYTRLIRYFIAAKNSGNDRMSAEYTSLHHYTDVMIHELCELGKKDRPEYIKHTVRCLLEATLMMLLEKAYESGSSSQELTQVEYYYVYIKNTGCDKLYAELTALPPSSLGYLPMQTIEYVGDKQIQKETACELLLTDLRQVVIS